MANNFIEQLKTKFAELTKKGQAPKKEKKAPPKKKKKIKITPLYVWEADEERLAGNAEDALKILMQGKEKFPGRSCFDHVLSAVYFDLGNLDEALKLCDEILAVDPGCISVLRRKGEIFDKQGNTVERNRCFRLVHDIDPLDEFWKEEYAEVPPAEVPFVEFSDGLDMPVDDMVLPVDDMVLPMDEDASADATEADPFAALNSMDNAEGDDAGADAALEDSLDSALDSVEPMVETPVSLEDESMSGSDVSSAISDFFGDEENDAVEEKAKPASPFSAFAVPASIEDEQPTASAGLFEKSSEEPVSEAATEDKPTSIDDAFGDIFGDDELPEETSTAEESFGFEKSSEEPVAEDKPTSIDDAFGDLLGDDELPEEKPVEEPAAEDKPTSIDDAFGDIFGDDELPEEKTAEEPAAEDSFGFEKSSEEPVAEETSEENFDFSVPGPAMEIDEDEPAESLASLLGDVKTTEAELDLDEEQPAGNLADLLDSLENPKTENVADENAVEESHEDVADAIGSMFGDDDLPEEISDDTTENLEASFDKVFEEKNDEAVENVVAPAETEALHEDVSDAIGAMFGDDDLPEENATVETPAVEEIPDDTAESLEVSFDKIFEEKIEEPAEDTAPAEVDALHEDVSDAIGAMFGDDDLPEEKVTVEEPVAEEIPDDSSENLEDFSFTKSVDATEDVETPVEEVLETPADSQTTEEVDSAFGALFGDDDLPEEKTEVEELSKADVITEIPDDADESLDFVFDEKVEDKVEETPVAEEPVAESAPEVLEESSETQNDVDGAFASLFGDDDDDLELPSLSAEPAPAVEETPVVESAPVEESVLDSMEVSSETQNDVDGAFASLFGDDDDDLELPSLGSSEARMPEDRTGAFETIFNIDDEASEEKVEAQDSIDFLMSGDSDDELSRALLKDPKESLNNNADQIDESLNTRTLAEIYFEQGLYEKSLEIYKDLAAKKPENESIAARLAEIQKVYDDKFGGN